MVGKPAGLLLAHLLGSHGIESVVLENRSRDYVEQRIRAGLIAGIDHHVPGVTLNRFCGSGLEAVNIAAQKVASGWADLVLAGGVESMSRVPMGSDGGAWAMDPESNYATSFVPQGVSADLIATLEGFTRDDADAYAAWGVATIGI